MAQDLALILSTPIEELAPKLIAWNNAELLEAVKTRLTSYKGRIYDESSITTARADRSALNKFAQALDDERKRIKAIYDAPLVKFTNEVNEVIAEVKNVSLEIDTQVKSYEQEKAKKKLAEIKEYFSSVIPETLAPFIFYEKIHKKEWLNANKSMASIKKEIDAQIAKITQELETIKALGDDGNDLKALYFETLSLADAISAHERRKAEKQRIAEAQAAADKKNAEARQEAQEPAPAAEEKEYSVSFKVTGTAEQLKALSAYLQNNKLKYEQI